MNDLNYIAIVTAAVAAFVFSSMYYSASASSWRR